jgi:glycosyltransferase involved in cell wall biosynthesis
VSELAEMEPMEFRVSVVITSYNQREYLKQALDSVIGQSLPPYEIIVADDASSDGSQELIEFYMDRYPGLVKAILHRENRGIPRNRNSALGQVEGDYVGILDGDDLFVPDKLERQYRALRLMPGARAVYGNFKKIDPQGRPLGLKWTKNQPQGNIFPEVACLKFGLLRTLVADYRAVKAAGLLDENYGHYDGLWLTIKLAQFCKFAYVHEPLVLKREHAQGWSKDKRRKASGEFLRELSRMHRDLQPLLASVDHEVARKVNASWQAHLAKMAGSVHRHATQSPAGRG